MAREESLLRLYIDSADPAEWSKYLATGMFIGVTTNPKLIAQAGLPFQIDVLADLASRAFSLGAKEIHLQAWGKDVEEMLEIGRGLAAIDDRVMVKIPIHFSGILVANQLIDEGAKVTLTALHAAQQALTAVGLGAKYAAPYLGRMSDGGMNGFEEVIQMGRIIRETNSSLQLVVASIRQVEDLVNLASRGITCFTLQPKLLQTIYQNDLTDKAVQAFDAIVKNAP